MTWKQIVDVAVQAIRKGRNAHVAVITALDQQPRADRIPEGDYGCDDLDADGLVDEIVGAARDMLRRQSN